MVSPSIQGQGKREGAAKQVRSRPACPRAVVSLSSRITMIDPKALESSLATFADGRPFRHCVIDDFVPPETARKLESEVLPYDSPKWFVYKNQIEDKKALNDWNIFPAETYRFFQHLHSPEFVAVLSKLTGTRLYADPGLHGGGWHAHGPGGNLNPHLDYSIHPKLGLQRKLNIILYISSELKPAHGGHLGLWGARSRDESARQARARDRAALRPRRALRHHARFLARHEPAAVAAGGNLPQEPRRLFPVQSAAGRRSARGARCSRRARSRRATRRSRS